MYAGTALLDQAKLSGFRDPVFARLAAHGIRGDEMYLVAYDAPTAARYARQLALKFSPHAVRVLRAGSPGRLRDPHASRTTSRAVGLGLPDERVALARELGLQLVPRLQNDERFRGTADRRARSTTRRRGHDAHTVIFFGLRNQVLGYPDDDRRGGERAARRQARTSARSRRTT